MEIVHAGAGNTSRITRVELHPEPGAFTVGETLVLWIERQYRHSAAAMMRSISPVGIVKHRPGFAQTVRPRKGSIVASPVLGAYDPEPDYFFHWYRDSAVVVDALRLLFEDPNIDCRALEDVGAFVRFSLSLQELDGRILSESSSC